MTLLVSSPFILGEKTLSFGWREKTLREWLAAWSRSKPNNHTLYSKIFAPIHPPDALATLPPECYIGSLDLTTVPDTLFSETEEEIQIREAREALPHPGAALNLQEIEVRIGVLDP